jgi:chemotaxis protein MotB
VARRHQHEEHQNHEAWAIPYGDLITLLLAFFVVMYAISSVNAGKYRVLSNALNAAFRGTPTTPELIPIGTHDVTIQETMPASTVTQLFNAGLPVQRGAGELRAGRNAGDSKTEAALALAKAEALQQQELASVEGEVSGVLDSLIKSHEVHVQLLHDAVQVQIGADVLFASGVSEPSSSALPILKRLGEALRPYPNSIRIEGHTDDVPIHGGVFHSNWELSGARAGSVVRLLAEEGIDPQRLEVVGFGEFRPIQPNETAAGRNSNRRVVLMILGRTPSGAMAAPRSE